MVALINTALLRAVTSVHGLRARLSEQRGQDLLEYALLGGLIAAALIAAAFFLTQPLLDLSAGIGRCIDFDSTSICGPF